MAGWPLGGRASIRLGCCRTGFEARFRDGSLLGVADPLHLTILFDEVEDGWIVASVPEVPGAHSQGKSKDEARENVLDALAGLLELRASAHERSGRPLASESLDLVVPAA